MQMTTGDIRKEQQLLPVLKDVDVIIHCAAVVDLTQNPDRNQMKSVNVDGTQTLLDAAVESNVPAIVYISGADVAVGSTPVYYGSENTTLIPKDHILGAYSKTKYDAELKVLEANGRKLPNGKSSALKILLPNFNLNF